MTYKQIEKHIYFSPKGKGGFGWLVDRNVVKNPIKGFPTEVLMSALCAYISHDMKYTNQDSAIKLFEIWVNSLQKYKKQLDKLRPDEKA